MLKVYKATQPERTPVVQQEPGTEEEILNGVKNVRPGGGFVPNFQLFAKIEVNGENEHPLYTYLKVHALD